MRDDAARLLDMLLACRDARRFVEGITEEQFMADEKTQASVCLKLEIIGEAPGPSPNRSKRSIRRSSGGQLSGCGTASSTSTSALTSRSFGRSCRRTCLNSSA